MKLDAFVPFGPLFVLLLASACGGEDDAFAGHNKACLAVAGRLTDLWLECGVATDRNETIASFGCDDVEDAPKEDVDQCIARLDALTCANATSLPGECVLVFQPQAPPAQ